MKVFCLLLLLCIVGCATSKKGPKSLDEISQEDFKPVKSVKYNKSDDNLSKVKSNFTSVSNDESIQRIYKYDGDVKLDGDLGKLASLCYEKKFDEAVSLVRKINKKYVSNPIFWNHVGTCFLLKKERRKALLFFNKSISFKSNYAPALNNLGIMYVFENDYSRALVAFKKAKRYKNFSSIPRLNLANLYLNFGLFDKSIKELSTLYAISSSDVDVLNLLGTAYLMKGEYKKSLSYYSKIDSDFFEDPRFGINYAVALSFNGNNNKAKKMFADISINQNKVWKDYYNTIKAIIGDKK